MCSNNPSRKVGVGVDVMMTPYSMIKIVSYNKDLTEKGFLGSWEISTITKISKLHRIIA